MWSVSVNPAGGGNGACETWKCSTCDQEGERDCAFLADGALPQPDFAAADMQSPTPRRAPAPPQSLVFAIPLPSSFPEDDFTDIVLYQIEVLPDTISVPAPSAFPEDAQMASKFEQGQGGVEDATSVQMVERQLSRMRALLNPERSGPMVSCRAQNSKTHMMRSSDSAGLGSPPWQG